MKSKVLIIGAGLAGLTAAYFLKKDYILCEAKPSEGGLSGTVICDGFKLDHAIHVLYFKTDWVLSWLTDELQIKLNELEKHSSVFIYGNIIPFPLQFNLRSIPYQKRIPLFTSFCRSRFLESNNGYSNFGGWADFNFGKKLAADFFRPYNEKLFGAVAEEITTEWMGDYIPPPSVAEVIKGFLFRREKKFGRNSTFYYPAEGGIGTAAAGIKSRLTSKPLVNEALVSIDLAEKKALFASGLQIEYEQLVSTIPLDKLISMVLNTPAEVEAEAARLRANPTTLLHLMLKGKINTGGLHWLYFPEPAVPFYRITFPENLCRLNCPDGRSALTLEFGGRVKERESILNNSIDALSSAGIIDKSSVEFNVLWEEIDTGYVIYDPLISGVRKFLTNYLAQNSVLSIGRYGNWEYSNMESAISAGRLTAERINML